MLNRIKPATVYLHRPCSVVAVGTAMGLGNSDRTAINALYSPKLKKSGYLSLPAMNTLVRAHLPVRRCVKFTKGNRPTLAAWAESHAGTQAVICVLGHFLYYDGTRYHSYGYNAGDPVVCVWELDK